MHEIKASVDHANRATFRTMSRSDTDRLLGEHDPALILEFYELVQHSAKFIISYLATSYMTDRVGVFMVGRAFEYDGVAKGGKTVPETLRDADSIPVFHPVADEAVRLAACLEPDVAAGYGKRLVFDVVLMDGTAMLLLEKHSFAAIIFGIDYFVFKAPRLRCDHSYQIAL